MIKYIKKIWIIFLISQATLLALAQNSDLSNQSVSKEDFLKFLNLSQRIDFSPDKYRHLRNSLYSKDFSLPEGAQIIHFPMIHGGYHAPKDLRIVDSVKMAARSQWKALQFIRKHPKALVFEEIFWTPNELNDARSSFIYSLELIKSDLPYQKNISYKKVLNNIKKARSFKDLNKASQRALYYNGGSKIALLTGVIDRLYPSTLLSSKEEIKSRYYKMIQKDPEMIKREIDEIHLKMQGIAEQYNQTKSADQIEQAFSDLFKKRSHLEYIKSSGFLGHWREYLLSKSVAQAISENPGQMVIINYGAAHDLSDAFKDYNFHRLPHSYSFSIQGEPSLSYIFLYYGLFSATDDNPSFKRVLSEFLYKTLKNKPSDFLRPLFSVDRVFWSTDVIRDLLTLKLQPWEYELDFLRSKTAEELNDHLQTRLNSRCQDTFGKI